MPHKELRQTARSLSPVVRIGKKGVPETVLKEIEKLLRKRKLIKIKILQNAPQSRESIIRYVVHETHADLITSMGNVFVLYSDPKR